MKNFTAIATSLVALLALLPWVIGGQYLLHLATMVAIMSILALGMNLMLRIGQLSLAHAAFMGLGAYGSALLTMRLGLPPLVAMLLCTAVVGLCAVALGFVILRIKGVFFVLLTYAFGQIINLVFQEWVSLFGGNNGMHSIPKFAVWGMTLKDPGLYYLFVLSLAVGAWLVVRSIFRSDVGDILNAINEDEEFSRSLGTNALAWRAAVFGLSAAMASVAGSLYAHHMGFLSPAAFSFFLSVDVLVINIIGGVLSAFGPVLGALILVPLPELLRDAREYQLLAYGSILLGCLLFFREGIVGQLTKLLKSRSVQS
jgi:branched-chain amino acid transport system permease protein